MKGLRLVIILALGALCRADDWVNISSDNYGPVNINTTVTLSSQAHSDPEELYGHYIWYIAPDGTSQILWSTYQDYIFQNDDYKSGTLTLNQSGTWEIHGNASYYPLPFDPAVTTPMDSGPIYIYVNPSAPSITSAGSESVSQGQPVSYQITATQSPTSYGASNLPSGLTVNTSTGLISGALPTNNGATGSNSTVTSTISAANAYGNVSQNVAWYITAAQIAPNAQVTPTSIANGSSISIARNGSTNFGLAWTEATIWFPSGSGVALSREGFATDTYTPSAGEGTYYLQYRIVDIYYNYMDEWVAFTVSGPSIPSSFQASTAGSTFVALSWGASSSPAGISYYKIYRNGTVIAQVSGTSYTDNGLSLSTGYTYGIQAVDGNGNASAIAQISVTTAGDLEVFTPLP